MSAPLPVNGPDGKYRKFVESRLIGMRTVRYSWWSHWRELASYFLPRRYRWLIPPNQSSRGSPINQLILDETGCVVARNLAAGLMSGKTSPLRPWFSLSIGEIDSTQTSPVSLWLAECERLLRKIFHESNFYNCVAQFYHDLVIFGTANMLIYEDYENVINCYNPCAGEYYVDIDGRYRPVVFYREFTMTIAAVVDEFGLENCSVTVAEGFRQGGAALIREIIVAHAIEPNDDGRAAEFGFDEDFAFREVYWEWGSTAGQQSGAANYPRFLRKKGYYEQPHSTARWDLVGNDPYGRSVGMDGLPGQKQLQVETRRKGQAIDKIVNPPMVADVQLKNQPASLLPGGITYVNGFTSSGKPGFASAYNINFSVKEVSDDLVEVRERLKMVFYNHLFQPISQFETRSNVTAYEVDQRKAESLIMLGPVFTRIDDEGLKVWIDRTFAIAARAGILPPPPEEIAGMEININFVSMLANAQDAIQAASIERCLGLVGNIVAVKPDVIDNIDTDFAIDKYAKLLNNDPRMINSPEQKAAIREERAKQQQAANEAAIAEQLSKGAKNLASADMGGGQNALQAVLGGV